MIAIVAAWARGRICRPATRVRRRYRREDSPWRRLESEPTLHFIGLRALLFVLYPLVAPRSIPPTYDQAQRRGSRPAGSRASSMAGQTPGGGRRPNGTGRDDGGGSAEQKSWRGRRSRLASSATTMWCGACSARRGGDARRERRRRRRSRRRWNFGPSLRRNPRQFGGGPEVSFFQVGLDPARRGADLARDAAVL